VAFKVRCEALGVLSFSQLWLFITLTELKEFLGQSMLASSHSDVKRLVALERVLAVDVEIRELTLVEKEVDYVVLTLFNGQEEACPAEEVPLLQHFLHFLR
jgi:hypothetical protein